MFVTIACLFVSFRKTAVASESASLIAFQQSETVHCHQVEGPFLPMNLRTLNDVFFTVVERNQPRVMLHRENGVWTGISAADLRTKVANVATALRSWGISKGDRVAILSENRPEWTIADF